LVHSSDVKKGAKMKKLPVNADREGATLLQKMMDAPRATVEKNERIRFAS